MKDFVLAMDTGKHFAAALLSHENERDIRLEGMYYQHQKCFETEDVRDLCNRLGEMLSEKGVEPSQLSLAIEVPSHRYFGRANSSALLKAFWQGVRVMIQWAGQCKQVVPVPADQWNQQRQDDDKKSTFKTVFPDFKKLPYYQEKHGSRSNAHERDAALFGRWYIRSLKDAL